AAGSSPLLVVSGDFNNDGRIDLATGNGGTNDISVLLGKGDGSFQARAANAIGNGTSALATGDFTGNGMVGVVAVNSFFDYVTIRPGNGDGTFQRSLTVPLPAGSAAGGVVAVDFNGDGRTDLAITDQHFGQVLVFLGNGDGTFKSLPPISLGGSPY